MSSTISALASAGRVRFTAMMTPQFVIQAAPVALLLGLLLGVAFGALVGLLARREPATARRAIS